MIVADSTIYICKGIPFTNDYDHTRLFTDEASRLNYFVARAAVPAFTSTTLVKPGEPLRWDGPFEEVKDCNYLVYRNPNGKWYYNFITSVKYGGISTAFIYYDEDVLNTWWEQLVTKESFVKREHVNNDGIAQNLVPENLETGEFVINKSQAVQELEALCILLGFSWTGEPSTSNVTGSVGDSTVSLDVSQVSKKFAGGGMQCNRYSGTAYVAYNDPNEVNRNLQTLTETGQIDMVTSISMMPQRFLPSGYNWGERITTAQLRGFTHSFNFSGALNGYTPKNKKLLTGEFNYLLVDNMNGSTAQYMPEFFSTYPAANFSVVNSFGPDAGAKMVPSNYKGWSSNYLEALNIDGWPLCSYSYNAYERYLGQNKNSIATRAVTGGLATAGTVVSQMATAQWGSALGTIFNAASEVANTVAKHTDRLREPNSVKGNSAAAPINIAMGLNTYILYQMCPTARYAKRIDDYLSMYGYTVNEVKIPNFFGRKSWNYVQTIGANLQGNIPVEALNKIRTIFDKGITFWHTDDVSNYTLDNSIV